MAGFTFTHLLLFMLLAALFLMPSRFSKFRKSIKSSYKNFKDTYDDVQEAEFREMDPENPAEASKENNRKYSVRQSSTKRMNEKG